MIKIKQISSLEKVKLTDGINYKEINKAEAFKGEKFSYQICALSDLNPGQVKLNLQSELKDYIELYIVKNSVMDIATYIDCKDTDYITKKPGLMPDLLIPAKESNYTMFLTNGHTSSVWIRVCLPEGIKAGIYTITLTFSSLVKEESQSKTLELEIMDEVLPDHGIVATQWFHTDSISLAHGVRVYSKKHWELIESYIAMAADIGLNMILTPVITPPLDTAIGLERKNVQLVDIERTKSGYSFDFSKLHKWVDICKRNGIKYYEISHLFSQWGSKYAPNIYVKVEGRLKHYFGWHIASDSNEYKEFLHAFLPALCSELEKMNIQENTYFHISDEPSLDNIDTYKKAYDIIKPYIGKSKTMDALSNYEFYEKGIVECPVTASDHIDEFLKHNIRDQWVYYCCGQHTGVSNRFLSMPSYRNRIMGVQMYKYGIKGFLHWGYNFYNARYSYYSINPYVTSSSDIGFPSGDAYTVYPGKKGPYPSLRGFVFQEGLQDIALCRLLENYIGHNRVVSIIEDVAGMEIKIDKYPKSNQFFVNLKNRLIKEFKTQIRQTTVKVEKL